MTLPEALEAEQATLGSILLEPTAAAMALSLLEPRDFAPEHHQRIFRAMQSVQARNEPVDLITVKDELARMGVFEQVGGAEYLAALINTVPTAAHVGRYSTLVAEKSVLRKLIQAGADIQEAAERPDADPEELVKKVQTSLAEIAERTRPTGDQGLPVTPVSKMRERLQGVEWVWPGWLPRGFLTMLAGQSGEGKTALAMYVAAAFAGLGHWPDGTPAPPSGGRVIWYDSESTQQMFCSRSEAWGLTGIEDSILHLGEGGVSDLHLEKPGAAQTIASTATREGAGLVIVDSLSAAHRADENDSKIRGFLGEMADAARDHRLCFMCVHHLRKKSMFESETVTLDRLRGSSAIGQLFRVVWALSKPSPDSEAVALEVIKTNLGVRPPALGFEIFGTGLTFCDPPQAPRVKTVRDQAAEFLLNELAREPQAQKALFAKAAAEGISDKTLRRAAKGLGIVSVQRGDGWYWSLLADGHR